MADNTVNLPPGFRFYPTDEELIVHFLHRKASLLPCHPDVIPDLELYPYDPWDLQGKALGEGNQWYYYSRRTQNRVTVNGYWKAMGMEEAVIAASSNKRVGMKKYFVFFEGEHPNSGIKTNWVMQEYRLSDSSSSSSSRSPSSSSSRRKSQPKPDYRKWVICRVYERDNDDDDEDGGDNGIELSCLDEVFLSMDDLEEISLPVS
ncbi:NAC domain-containing protein 104-like [Neltuma alba]|uniref:NAC domain-containing protein 104-like n=1 Tax=Neltuma alba TaxID=207710 RepID=UPI0010A3BE49|nr:NAC domain-containing protein 104-like [Prosopis alba]XP_028800855.1 NAC domain-containing protein 104-like [Prosopis alba]